MFVILVFRVVILGLWLNRFIVGFFRVVVGLVVGFIVFL